MISRSQYEKNLDQKVRQAKETNSRMDSVANRAKQVQQKKAQMKFNQLNEAIKKYHEKLLIRKDILDW